MRYLTRIPVDFSPGKSKFVDYVVTCVTIFPGMVTICMNIGREEIEMS